MSLREEFVTLALQPGANRRELCRRFCISPQTGYILHRHGLISVEASAAAQPWHRFEHEAPNALWQIDFKGHVETPAGRCHPLTLLDGHSRYNMALRACARQEGGSVQAQLTQVFRTYGLPVRMNCDNGAPWGSPREPGQVGTLALWLIRLGIRVSFSRPYHPQTNGKEERFHRSLEAEVLDGRSFAQHLRSAAEAAGRHTARGHKRRLLRRVCVHHVPGPYSEAKKGTRPRGRHPRLRIQNG